MLEGLYEKRSYEVLKRTAEDRSARIDCTIKKVPKTCSKAGNFLKKKKSC